MISIFWIGEINYIFIGASILLGITFSISSIAEPQYILNLGSGRLNPNMYTMIIASVLTFILGYSLGYFFKGFGVLLGYTIAFSIANIYLIYSTEFDKKQVLRAILNSSNLFLLGISLICVFTYYNQIEINAILNSLLSAIVFTLVVLLYLYREGSTFSLITALRK